MPVTYVLISSQVLSATASNVTFSSIPSTYTDLVLRSSTRSTSGTIWASSMYYQFNSGNATVTMLTGTGSAAQSLRSTLAFAISDSTLSFGGDSAGNTANTFQSNELYLPSYLSSTTKPASNFSAAEQNGSTSYMSVSAYLRNNTAAINSISIIEPNTFAIGSSFYLYGIKNS